MSYFMSGCDIPDSNWSQTQLSPSMGGLGLHSLSGHSLAAFIFSLAASGFGSPDNIHLQQAVAQFNSQVSQHDIVPQQKVLGQDSCQELAQNLPRTFPGLAQDHAQDAKIMPAKFWP